MRKRLTIGLLALGIITLLGAKKTSAPPPDALSAIQASDIRAHIDFLASDSLKGRNTPSPQLQIAAKYIADYFKQNGLAPVNGSYFAPFKVGKVRLGKDNSLKISKSGTEKTYRIKKEFMPYDLTGNKAVSGEVVFAGYGITAPDYHYDDYADVEVKGKLVLILRHEPGEKNPESLFDGTKATPHSQLRHKVENAIEHGAIGVLVVTDPLNHRSLRPRGFPWPSLFEAIPNNALPLRLAATESEQIPVVQVGKKVIKEILGNVAALRDLQTAIDSTLQPQSKLLPGVQVSLQTSTVADYTTVDNVVGYLEGRDPKLKNEMVILGAHYDHVGMKKNAAAEEDSIFNGADDNASGTSLLLAMAKAFGTAPQKPKRSVLLIAFAGEEKGLFGSRAYVEHPLFSLDKAVAMLNFDMVGRNAPDSVSIGGKTRSPDLVRINEEENRYIGMHLDYSIDQYYNRSDQYPFAKNKIPFLFYFTGLHKDYHKVSDHAYKINVNKIAMIAKLGFRVAWRIANTDAHFQFVEP